MADATARHSVVYRICPEEEWAAAKAAGGLLGGQFDKESGFVHLSTSNQVEGVLPMFYAGFKDLLLLEIDAAALGDGLRYEAAPDLGLFPHFYGPSGEHAPLPLTAVLKVHKLELKDGHHVLPF
eukprot:jgi/Mesen1/9658/ME000671S09015